MKIFVLFVEPMLYGMDLIHEVYEKTEYVFCYQYCTSKLTGKDDIVLPENASVCQGTDKEHKAQVITALDEFHHDFVVINGYVGTEQITTIRYCQKHHIPYAIESDTPLHIPENKFKALLKRIYLSSLLHSKFCYGFPGGTLQKENLVYYGIPEQKNFIMPMSVSSERLLKAADTYSSKAELQEAMGLQRKKVFLFVGRLAKEKNVALLIDAYAELKKQRDDIALLIVGDGAEREHLHKQIDGYNLKDVHFMGYVVFPELVKYYKMADFFVLPSVHEPWGLVVNEAMIMGLPVIVSSKVGCRLDLVEEGRNGFIFESENTKALVHKMSRLLQNDYEELSGNSKKKSKQWSYSMYKNNFVWETQCL